jgi:hypothetical protein
MATVTITDEVVRHLTETLCDGTMAVIRTLRPEDQQGYIDSMCERTRRALEEVADA